MIDKAGKRIDLIDRHFGDDTAAARLVLKETSIDTMSKNLEETLAKGVKDQRVPHAVVRATNADGTYRLPTLTFQRTLIDSRPGSWTYNYATGPQTFGASGESTIGEDAEFMLASSTKLLTTIVILQAVEKGLVGLDDDVGEKIPELAKQGILKGFDAEDKPILEERKNPLTLR